MAELGHWRGRRVLVTGHTGFKGTWLTCMLARLGARVHGYALDPEPESLFGQGAFGELLASDVRADLSDAPALVEATRHARPEVVMHLAAQPLVRESYERPVETMRTNIMGTLGVLEAVRATPSVRAVLVITTDKVYRNLEHQIPYAETDPLGGHDPYSASKAAAEIVTDAYRLSFPRHGLAIATARAGNVLGGGDAARDRLVPDLIRSFSEGRPALVRSPEAVRPWQHVLDPLCGYLRLAETLLHGHVSGSWNFGPEREDQATVAAVADVVARLWGQNASWVRSEGDGRHEAGLLMLDAAKARSQLGWRPILDLRGALEWTVDWWRQVGQGRDPRQVTQEQTEQYFLCLERPS